MITTAALSQTHRDAARDLLDTVTAHDGVAPLDEAARLAVAGGDAHHLLLEHEPTGEADGDRLLGYASVLTDGTVQGMVHPAHRRRGHGTALLQAALDLHDEPGVWAHGALEGSLAFLAAAGLQETRRLLTLHRPLDADHPLAPVPAPRLEGLHLDAFDADRDADRWVQVNALAFADHPEQGALTRADLDQRMAEPWFDAQDMVVARYEGELVGFVWIKREAPEQAAKGGAEPTDIQPSDAEIYVVATDPSVQGQGVAGFLLAAALERLRTADVPGVELYVEADNAPALRLYENWGFVVSGRDVQMRPTGKG
ncbi:MAG: mycothiol synthase [Brachybacterium tyrofermentans]|uniref:mycothiol synthase n=1 Tax=Brachybacterium tyrofermentans TaxID=47848 RepID=UPI001866A871|nr:mycothiol synthase [Brachybacterium tyrofermentans]